MRNHGSNALHLVGRSFGSILAHFGKDEPHKEVLELFKEAFSRAGTGVAANARSAPTISSHSLAILTVIIGLVWIRLEFCK